MKQLNLNVIMERALKLYQGSKTKLGYPIPMELPSDQIKSIARAIVEEINKANKKK